MYIEAHRGSASSVASACHQEDLGMSFAVLMLVASRTIFYLGIFGIFWVWKFKQETLNILKQHSTAECDGFFAAWICHAHTFELCVSFYKSEDQWSCEMLTIPTEKLPP